MALGKWKLICVTAVFASWGANSIAQSASPQDFIKDQSQAQSGVAKAQLNLGKDYLFGVQTEKSYASAMVWA